MKMKFYNFVWISTLVFLSYEYYALNVNTHMSLLLLLQKKSFIRDTLKISPEPGRLISLWLGWLGLGFMLLMNVYSMRKRISFLQKLGKLSSWLNFHIFCGLIGPTLILFHCNFKVRGFVAISFWSMVISFSSGIVGKYFYVQMLKAKVDLEKDSERILTRLKAILQNKKIQFDEKMIQDCMNKTLAFVGVPSGHEDLNPFKIFAHSTLGDIRRTVSSPAIPKHWPELTKTIVTEAAVQKRRALFLESFQRLMGYWHTLHFPFAVFMYLAAVFHVTAALLFGI